MKKMMALMLALVLVSSTALTGCNRSDSEDVESTASTESISSTSDGFDEPEVETPDIRVETPDIPVETIDTPDSASSKGRDLVEKDFAIEPIEDLGYTAPTVHDTFNGECLFLWDHSEADVLDWIDKKYDYIDDDDHSVKIRISNDSDRSVAFKRYERIVDSKSGETDNYELTVTSSGYSESCVSSVQLFYSSLDQDTAIQAGKDLLEYMGFGDYVDELIHMDDYIEVPVENRLGKYKIFSYYSFSDYTGLYYMNVGVEYSDSAYVSTTIPDTFEEWEDDHDISEFILNSSIDTSSVESFITGLADYCKENINDTITYKTDPLYFTSEYEYEIDPGDDEKSDTEARYKLYIADAGNKEHNNSNLTTDIHISISQSNIAVYVNVSPVYEQNVWSLSDDQINELVKLYVGVIKQINKDINITEADLLKAFDAGVKDDFVYKDDEFSYYCSAEMGRVKVFIT